MAWLGDGGGAAAPAQSGGGLTGRYQAPAGGVTLSGPQKWSGSGTSDYTAPAVQAPAKSAVHPSMWGGIGDFFSQLYNAGKGMVGSTANAIATPVNAAIGLAQTVQGDQKGAAASAQRVQSGINDVKGIAQAVPRGLLSIGLGAMNPFAPKASDLIGGADRSYTPSGTLAKAIFGDAPVQSVKNAFNSTQGSLGSKLGAGAVTLGGDVLSAGGAVDAPHVIANKALNTAVNNYSNVRLSALRGADANAADAAAAAARVQAAGVAGAATAKTNLAQAPGGAAAPLALPAETAGSAVKTTAGPNAGVFQNPDHVPSVGNTVSPETTAKIQTLDDQVHQYNQTGPSPNAVQQLGTLNAMRLNAAAAVKGLAEDRAQQETSQGQNPNELIMEAHQQLATGTDPASLHYQHAMNVAKEADAQYQNYVNSIGGTKPVVDVMANPATPEVKASAQTALDSAKAEAASQINPQMHVPTATADALTQHLSDLRGGRTHGSELSTLNELIQHPDVANADKTQFVKERDALLPSRQGAEAPAPVPSAHEPVPVPGEPIPKGSGTRVAFDYNPDSPEANYHEPVPAGDLHPGARNVFAETHPTALGDTKGAPMSRDATASVYNGLAADTQALAKGMTPHDLKLIDQIESNTPMTAAEAADRIVKIAQTADNPKQFIAVTNSMKMGKDTRYLSDTAGLGRDMGYVQNHLTHVYENAKPAATPFTPDNGLPGYMKGRVLATKAEAEALSKQPGFEHLKPADINAVEAHIMAMKGAAFEHGDEAFRQGIDQAHPGAVVGKMVRGQYDHIMQPNGVDLAPTYNARAANSVQSTPLGVRTEDGHVQPVKDNEIAQTLKANPNSRLVNAATGEDLHSNKVARIMRGVAEHPLTNGYDKINAGLKTSALGGGTFHALTTAGTVAGQQAVRGVLHPLEAPKMIVDNLKLVGSTLDVTGKTHAKVQAGFDARGTTGFAQRVGATLGNLGKLDVGNPRIPVISQIHDAVFQRQIPQAKLMIMEQTMNHKFPGMDMKNPTPEQIQYGRDIASQVNNLGGINRAVEGLSPKAAKILGRVMLAPDYTEGKFRTIGNALTNPGVKGNIARQAVVGKTVLFALPGLTALTLAGKINWNDPNDWMPKVGDQILDPAIALGTNGAPTKTNPEGTPQSAHLPTTFISELGKIIKPALEAMGPNAPVGADALSGAKSWLTNRAAAAIGITTRIATNKDFYGNPIIGGNDKNGNPISAGKSALNVASQVLPIPGVQAIKQLTGQQGLRDSILNTAGLRVASDSSSPQAARSAEVNSLYNAFNPRLTTSQAVSKNVQSLVAAGNVNEAHRVAQDWNTRLQAFDRNYPAGMGPQAKAAWDAKWKTLEIKTNPRSDAARAKAATTSKTLLNVGQ